MRIQCLVLQPEQLAAEELQELQSDAAVLLKLGPTEKAQTDMSLLA